ncbi:MAG TPA: hypothetical protein ENI48_05320, partial [Thioploca sp.]|nr:hypothetical protein [Thioploca sp.]
VAGSLVNFAITFFFSRQFVKIRLRFNMVVWKNVIKDAWPIALSIAFNLVYFKADTIILSLYHSEATVGIYGASYKVLEVLTTLPAMFAGLILPLLMVAWAVRDCERFRRVLQKAFDAMVMIAVPLAVGTVFLAGPIMDLIAPEFHGSAAVLRILIFATATIFVGNLFGNTVVAINKQRTMMWIYLGVSIVSLVGYLYFIPRYSYYGAAAMTVVSELMVTIAAGLIVCLTIKAWPSFKVFGKALVASGLMAVALSLLSGYNIAILLIVAVVVYLGIMILTKGITKEVLHEVLKRG